MKNEVISKQLRASKRNVYDKIKQEGKINELEEWRAKLLNKESYSNTNDNENDLIEKLAKKDYQILILERRLQDLGLQLKLSNLEKKVPDNPLKPNTVEPKVKDDPYTNNANFYKEIKELKKKNSELD